MRPPSEARLREALEAVHDPHVPASLRSMGMLESVRCDDAGRARVRVVMPCLACPGASKIVGDIERALAAVPGVAAVEVDLAWSGEWQRAAVAPQTRLLMQRNGIQI